MSTQWVVTNAAERVDLTEKNSVDTTFTVSNKGRVADRAVFEVVPGDGADPSWFAVEDPQRVVPANGSVAYLVNVAVPPTASPGSYSVQGRVYSADTAPEEGSVLSGRMLLRVGPQAAPTRRPFPWWVPVAAGLMVLVIGIATWIVLAGDEPQASAGPGPAAPVPAYARVPNLVTLTLEEATAELRSVGLTVGTVKHKHVPGQTGSIVQQGPDAATTVVGGTAIDLVVAVSLTAPPITAPINGGSFSRGSRVDMRWDKTEEWVSRWNISTGKQKCYYYTFNQYRDCQWVAEWNQLRYTPDANGAGLGTTFTTSFILTYQSAVNLGWYNTGLVRASVAAVDDFGNVGPYTTVEYWIK
jgi:hypothetical protein